MSKKHAGSIIKKNELYTAEIYDMTNTGAGVARVFDTVVFVQGAVDGDIAEIRIIKVSSSYCIAKTERIIKPSKHRTESGCAVSKRCGACAFRCITYEHELEIKQRYVKSSFFKQGIDITVNPVLSAGQTDKWRTKVQLPYSPSNGLAGYYAYHSNTIIPCFDCFLHAENFNEIAKFLCSLLFEMNIKDVRHLYLRKGDNTLTVCIVTKNENGPWEIIADKIKNKFLNITGIMLNINKTEGNVILSDKYIPLWGNENTDANLCGMKLIINPGAFYQINRPAAEIAYEKLYELSDVRNGDRILDLFCGIGTIGLFFSKKSADIHLIGVDTTESAILNAKQNAQLNNIPNTEFLCREAEKLNIPDFSADIIIVDPPRGGLAAELVKSIAEASPRTVAYMSCEASTLARDYVLFSQYGYTAETVTPVDLFPRTGHVEVVTLLTKSETNL